ncbi:MAG: gamma-glutamyltransferase [Planctomycetaceae bacterium]
MLETPGMRSVLQRAAWASLVVLVVVPGGSYVMPDGLLPWKARPVEAAEYDRPAAEPHQSRSAVVAPYGMAATSHPQAAHAAIEMLLLGGTAADAAIAANAVLGVVEPMSCGIGGDLFVIYWSAKDQKLYGLNASGRSPHSLTRDVFREQGMTEIPVYGPLSWSVPGCVDGWHELHQEFGGLEFGQTLGPAIAIAREGFAVSEVVAGQWKKVEEDLRKWPDSAKTFLVDGERAPEFGEIFRNPALAASYEEIAKAENGRDAFYYGVIAQKIAAFSRQNGGHLAQRDFHEHESEWVEPVSTTYRGHEVWQLPPNTQGIAVLQMLNILEGYDIRSMGRKSPEYLHLFVEAKKLAYADRAKYYSDPKFAHLPIAELISKEYAARQRARIDANKAAVEVPAGDPLPRTADTVYVTVVDSERNCCSLIQSNFHNFGSHVVPGDVGFVLQNRGALFALDENHLNRLEPRKRPFHTIIPGFVTKTDPESNERYPLISFGVMGGDMQPQGQVQVLVNMIDFGLNLQMAGDAVRIQHLGSQTPTGKPQAADGGAVAVESGIPAETVKALEERGHKIGSAPGQFGGYQAILIDWKHETLQGATESRKDGAALGY